MVVARRWILNPSEGGLSLTRPLVNSTGMFLDGTFYLDPLA